MFPTKLAALSLIAVFLYADFARLHSAPAGKNSAAGHALRLDIKRVDRLARRHEEAVALPAAETHIGAALRQQDAADQIAVRRKHRDSVLALAAGETAPDIAVGIDADTIGIAGHRVEKHAPIRDLPAIFDNVIDMHGLIAPGRVDDVEPRFVG